VELDVPFQRFYEEIELGAVPEGRIAEAWNRLQNYLVDKYGVSATTYSCRGLMPTAPP
jgi:hypothetical protein